MLGRWVVDQEQTRVFMFPPLGGREVVPGTEMDPHLRATGKARRGSRLASASPS